MKKVKKEKLTPKKRINAKLCLGVSKIKNKATRRILIKILIILKTDYNVATLAGLDHLIYLQSKKYSFLNLQLLLQ
jgi:hypothetical protein